MNSINRSDCFGFIFTNNFLSSKLEFICVIFSFTEIDHLKKLEENIPAEKFIKKAENFRENLFYFIIFSLYIWMGHAVVRSHAVYIFVASISSVQKRRLFRSVFLLMCVPGKFRCIFFGTLATFE